MNRSTAVLPRSSRAGRCAAAIGVLLLAAAMGGCISSYATEEGEPAAESQTEEPDEAASTAAAGPVILLTGFEPFGPERPANPSWEGIAELNGRTWKGYRLVAKQMQVVWGAPRKQLEEWIAQYRPVAVFSFGQGAGGSMSLESRASNTRGHARDNSQALPPRPLIIAEGPAEFQATADCQRLAKELSAKGYPVRVSTRAGRYLCEETLYCLEYLKTKHPLQSVLFCHVPPLGSPLGDERVTAQSVRKFVQDLLEAWYATARHEPAAAAKDPRQREVEELIRRYFRTWSAQDLKGYGECFLGNACVQFIDAQGQLSLSALSPFLASQHEAHRSSSHRMTEVPESIDIRFEAELARATVYWKLTAGPRSEWGYDHFTLMKSRGEWRIVNLVFYVTKRSD